MTGAPGAKGAPRPFTDERGQGQEVLGLGERERDALLAWVGENLTLVTCYPFYYVGSAPKRFIVHATQIEASPQHSPQPSS